MDYTNQMKDRQVRAIGMSWTGSLPDGLSDNFDYSQVSSPDDAMSFIISLPNKDRGKAAAMLYDHRDLIGHEMARSRNRR
jgi:hypothetical protein